MATQNLHGTLAELRAEAKDLPARRKAIALALLDQAPKGISATATASLTFMTDEDEHRASVSGTLQIMKSTG